MSINIKNRTVANVLGKVPLRTVLVIPFILQIIGAVGLVGYLSFKNGQRAVYEVASQLQNEVTERIQQNIKAYLAIPHQINQTNLNAVNMGINLQEIMNFKKYFWPELISRSDLDFIAYINNKGNLISGQRMTDGTLVFRLCNQATNFDLYAWNANEKGNITTVPRVTKNFDGRKILWYQDAVKARKKSWSQVDILFSEPKMHITALQPIYVQNGELEGVLGVSLRLDSISQFLQSLKVGKSGQTFVITHDGVLVATSTSEDLVRFNNNKGGLFKATESSDSVTQATARYLINQFASFKQIQKLQNLNVEIAGKQRFLQVVPYQDDIGLDWLIVVIVPESDFMEQINANTRNTIWLTLAALGGAIAIGIFTARLITQPVLRLTQASKELAAGNLDRQVETNDAIEIAEIDTLENSFNSMAAQLKASFTTLEAQKEILANKNEELHRLDQLKNEFLANTSHELRTPLNGIIGIAESLIDGATGDLSPTTQTNLNLIVSSGRRLANLINDILDFSKLRHNNLELRLQPVDLRAVTNIVLTLSQPLAAQKSLTLINSIPAEFPPAEADEDRLQQILHNLVGNAIKFTHSGTVTVSAKIIETPLAMQERVSTLAITIADTGIGIAEDKFERIFESFEQAEGLTAREYGGTGLGLAVTKQLVELHEGKINVKSQVGVGSQFTFTLPASTGKAESKPQIAAIKSIQNLKLPTPVGSPNLNQNISNEKLFKVLIVDDEPINRQVLINHLSLYNYAITEASNGPEALAAIENDFIPDLILLDLMMPQMTGYEVCQKIRDRYPAYELPIVMLTAKNQVADIVEGFESGVNDYLSKPIQKQEMLARIRTHLSITQLTLAYGRFVPRNFLKFLDKESIIDVQIGDAIMALFPESANDAVQAAIAMQKQVAIYNEERQQQGELSIAIGIGLHTGNLMLGTIGESERMETTVIADAVNLASRLEGLTKLYGAGILISHNTLCCLDYSQEQCFRFLDRVMVKGKKLAVAVFEVYDGDEPEQKRLKHQTQARFEVAVFLYYQQQFQEAQGIFQEVLHINPQDKATMVYIKRCEKYQQYGTPEGWEGMEALNEK